MTAKQWIVAAALATAAVVGLWGSSLAQPSAVLAQKASEADEIFAIAQSRGNVRIIVQFESPVPPGQMRTDAAGIASVRSQITTIQDAIITTHFGSATNPRTAPGFQRGITRFEITPGFAVNVTAAEMEALAADPRVKYINYDRAVPPTLIQSVPLIGMTTPTRLERPAQATRLPSSTPGHNPITNSSPAR